MRLAIMLPVEVRRDQAERLAVWVTGMIDPHDDEEDAVVIDLTEQVETTTDNQGVRHSRRRWWSEWEGVGR